MVWKRWMAQKTISEAHITIQFTFSSICVCSSIAATSIFMCIKFIDRVQEEEQEWDKMIDFFSNAFHHFKANQTITITIIINQWYYCTNSIQLLQHHWRFKKHWVKWSKRWAHSTDFDMRLCTSNIKYTAIWMIEAHRFDLDSPTLSG